MVIQRVGLIRRKRVGLSIAQLKAGCIGDDLSRLLIYYRALTLYVYLTSGAHSCGNNDKRAKHGDYSFRHFLNLSI